MTAAAQADVTPMLDRALEYLRAELPIFPVCSPLMLGHQHRDRETKRLVTCAGDRLGKTPLVRWRGYQLALPSEDEVRGWWAAWPHANIGMATGELSGILVLDADGAEARRECLQRGGLDETPVVWTGKVGGAHFHLAYPAGANLRNFARKLPNTDMRGEGGYVLLPPSLHANGNRYRWAESTQGVPPSPPPPWLLALIEGAAAADPGGAASAPIDVDEALGGFDAGQRDDGLFRFACRLRHDDIPQAFAELLIAEAARNCRPPFGLAEAVEKVRRAYKEYEAGSATPTVDHDGWFSPDGVAAPEAAPAPGESRYPIQTLADLVRMVEDDGEQLLEGVIWPLRVTWAFSDPNSGKTLFLLAALMHIAAGRPFCGKAVVQTPVLVFEEDSPLSVAGEYVVMLAEIYDFDLATLPMWINKVQGLRITTDDGAAIVQEAVEACPEKPGVVLFDACERIVPSDRFNTRELDPFTRTLQRLIRNRITPIVIDHTNRARPEKGKEQEITVTPMERLFGARAKSAISDAMLYFDGFLKNGPVRLVFAKFRGETPPTMTVMFDSATGFTIIESPLSAQNEHERIVLRFFNNAPFGEYAVADIEAALSLKRRTLERVLSVLTRRRWLLASGATAARRYRRNPGTDGF